eukprot:NODE_1555_length_1113_cov_135.362004.p1 GENE.NODE_1555_length_1113_cov_135.362004~~NODE_1555_length_1113_cov_135.362004.p1  ORF type:complete len:299 (+),score=82.86 NODE_1555_length_1113_cov_135.362004:89-898(+)
MVQAWRVGDGPKIFSGTHPRPLWQLLVLTCACSTAGAGFFLLHAGVYMKNGEGIKLLEVLGAICICIAKGTIAVLSLLVAKGWVFLYRKEEMWPRRFTLAALGTVLVTAATAEIHGQFFRDISTTLYLYESWSGILILVLNASIFGEALRSMAKRFSGETQPEARAFYRNMACVLCLYFVTLPLTCLLAALFSPWVRSKYVARVEVISRITTTALLTYFLTPTRLDVMINARVEMGRLDVMINQPTVHATCDSDDDAMPVGNALLQTIA